jgi:hypothetical protein
MGHLCAGARSRALEERPTAEPLGDLPGGAFHSGAACISRDKTKVIGTGTVAEGQEIAIWSDGPVRALGDLPGGDHGANPSP